jgi:hypothetical protein
MDAIIRALTSERRRVVADVQHADDARRSTVTRWRRPTGRGVQTEALERVDVVVAILGDGYGGVASFAPPNLSPISPMLYCSSICGLATGYVGR